MPRKGNRTSNRGNAARRSTRMPKKANGTQGRVRLRSRTGTWMDSTFSEARESEFQDMEQNERS